MNTRKLNDQVIEIMKKEGLEVDVPADLDAWRRSAAANWAVLRGEGIPTELFDEIKRYHDAFRAQRKSP